MQYRRNRYLALPRHSVNSFALRVLPRVFFYFLFSQGQGQADWLVVHHAREEQGVRGVFYSSLGAGREEKEGGTSRNRKSGETATLKAIVELLTSPTLLRDILLA